MNLLVNSWIFIFGTIIGSFLNVVIFRMNTGRGLGGRSMCLSCNRNLKWYELIPIISFFMQRGKCRKCKSTISWQYPIVEFTTGLLFSTAVSCLGSIESGTIILVSFLVISIGIVIAVYDVNHKIIHFPSLIVFFVAGTALVVLQKFGVHTVIGWGTLLFAVRDAVLVALPFFALWAISRGRWIGFGDIEIMAIAGWLLGLSGGYSAVFFGFWIACLAVLPIYGYAKIKKKHLDHQVPMGPFLLIGMYIVLFCNMNVFDLLMRVIY